MSQDRREFLATAGKVLVLTAPAAAYWDALAAGKTEPEQAAYRMADHFWGMIVDIDKCIGCGSCVRACKTENNVPSSPSSSGPGSSATTSSRFRSTRKLTRRTAVTTASRRSIAAGDKAKSFFVPKLCNQCAHSPCTQVCPVGATFEAPDGAVLVDKTYCLGCRYCVQACPYGCRFIDPRTETVDKCNLCYHRITKGLTTACCENCPTGARQLVDLKDPRDPVHEFLRTHKVHVLKPQMATGAKVFYNALDGSVR